jgi:hypothetical protein
MINESLQQLQAAFSRRFLFNALIPTFIFGSLTIGVVILSFSPLNDVVRWWERLDLFTQVLLLVGYSGCLLFLSAAVGSQWRGIVRLYEGYPLVGLTVKLGRRSAIGVRWHRRHLAELKDTQQAYQLYLRYPHSRHSDKILPSRLGNILLSGEFYPRDRYGVDAFVFFPRLYPLLPENFQKDLHAYILGYEFPLVVSFQAATATIICSVAILASHGPPLLFLAIFAGGVLFAYLSYCASLSPAEEFSEQLRTAFDLYRENLIDAWPSATYLPDEKAAFKKILSFVLRDAPADWDDFSTKNRCREETEQISNYPSGRVARSSEE